MKRLLILLGCFLLLYTSASAQTLPDVGISLDVRLQQQMEDYRFSPDYLCDVWVYPRDSRTDDLLAGWIVQALDHGYTVSAVTVDGQTAYRLEDADGLFALIFPQYQGAVMLMVQQGMSYAPALPSAAPQPTAAPAAPANSDGWGWVWVEVEKDCPSCVGGRCSVCNGTGVYRLYGEKVSCDPDCSSCDGLGSYTTQEYQYVKLN